MKIVRTVRLWMKEGTSDKVYEVDLVDLESDPLRGFSSTFVMAAVAHPCAKAPRRRRLSPRDAGEQIFESVVSPRSMKAIGHGRAGWRVGRRRVRCRRPRFRRVFERKARCSPTWISAFANAGPRNNASACSGVLALSSSRAPSSA